MKKLFIYLLVASFILSPVVADARLAPQKVVYRGTVTGLRISAVDGTAFIDGANSSITDLADGQHSIEIFDSTGKFLRGVLGSIGSGETVGIALTTGWINSDYAFETFTTSGVNITSGIETGTDGRAYGDVENFNGKLIKVGFDLTVSSGASNFSFILNSTAFSLSVASPVSQTTLTATGPYAIYGTFKNDSGYSGFRAWAAVNFSTANYYKKQVLTPSTAGATIVSAKGGATQSFSYKNASFAYNQASYTVIIKKLRG
jgi:hypothetical protein